MQSIKVLEMINQGRIDELKDLLRDEIYQDALKRGKPGAKQRYAAMKKYFGYVQTVREVCQKPCLIEFEGETRTSFCNSYSLVLTKEPCGAIELFTDIDRYPNVGRLVKREGDPEKIDFSKVIAEAKSLGYKLTKKEVNSNSFMIRYKDAYFRLGLFDASYSIINNGGEAMVYQNGNPVSPMVVENDIGLSLILPVKWNDEFLEDDSITVLDVN